ncbi:MAG: ATP synthase F1 subunit epsilon [Fusobacteriaceae bacterium]|nr:ATP synthase F1 subunit epsilon [Fusobacteriaceae bacterium]MBP9510358.1 ATP synthase F1 subunit epsilon [Fusobacteriaceae bacterium]
MSNFHLKIVTSKQTLLDEEAEFVMLRTIMGDMGILANHSPFVSELAIGEMKVRANGQDEFYYVSGGFLEISKDNVVTILADEAMLAKDIDIEHARRDLAIAEEKTKKVQEDREVLMTQRALQEALTKVKVAERFL